MPNPFHRRTLVYYALRVKGHVDLAVYSVTGKRISTIVVADEQAGNHAALCDLSGLPAGTYVCRLTAADHTDTRLLVKLE